MPLCIAESKGVVRGRFILAASTVEVNKGEEIDGKNLTVVMEGQQNNLADNFIAMGAIWWIREMTQDTTDVLLIFSRRGRV